jgi:ribosome biogenesis protein ERB1
MARKSKAPEPAPDPEPASSGSDSEQEYDSEAEGSESNEESGSEQDSVADSFDGEDFEPQGSSDDDEDLIKRQGDESDDDSFDGEGGVQILDTEVLDAPRQWKRDVLGKKSDGKGDEEEKVVDPEKAKEIAAYMHTDDLSSDDEDPEGTNNRIGRIPLHWYDDYEHIGYDAHGSKVIKSDQGNMLDQILQNEDDADGKKYTVYDALNAKNVQLTDRQIQLIRRLQSGAFAHPEHDVSWCLVFCSSNSSY